MTARVRAGGEPQVASQQLPGADISGGVEAVQHMLTARGVHGQHGGEARLEPRPVPGAAHLQGGCDGGAVPLQWEQRPVDVAVPLVLGHQAACDCHHVAGGAFAARLDQLLAQLANRAEQQRLLRLEVGVHCLGGDPAVAATSAIRMDGYAVVMIASFIASTIRRRV
jgi:hypothetical protein